MAQSESPARFSPGARSPNRPNLQATVAEDLPSQSQPEPVEDGPQLPPPDDPHRFQSRIDRLRDLAAGRSRPLGSPEGPAPELPNPRSKSQDSSKERRVVDTLALGVRQATKALDWSFGERLERDLIATSEECFAIAGPLAGELLDRIPETGPLAEMVEHAGGVGAGIGVASYALRVAFDKPGGRAESVELQERLVRRMRKTKTKVEGDIRTAVQEAEARVTAEPASDDDGEPKRIFATLYGEDDEGL